MIFSQTYKKSFQVRMKFCITISKHSKYTASIIQIERNKIRITEKKINK